jgi:predicted Zn finger-like uncharacterized protein
LIVTCPACQTRYRVDAAALARPQGRMVRCAACGHSWRHPPAAAALRPAPEGAEQQSERTIELAIRPEPVAAVASPPRPRFWRQLAWLLLVALVVMAVVATLYFFRHGAVGL